MLLSCTHIIRVYMYLCVIKMPVFAQLEKIRLNEKEISCKRKWNSFTTNLTNKITPNSFPTNLIIGLTEMSHHVTGINTGLSIAGYLREGNQTSSRTLVLFSMYSLETLGRGNQPQGWEIPLFPHPLNKSLMQPQLSF